MDALGCLLAVTALGCRCDAALGCLVHVLSEGAVHIVLQHLGGSAPERPGGRHRS